MQPKEGVLGSSKNAGTHSNAQKTPTAHSSPRHTPCHLRINACIHAHMHMCKHARTQACARARRHAHECGCTDYEMLASIRKTSRGPHLRPVSRSLSTSRPKSIGPDSGACPACMRACVFECACVSANVSVYVRARAHARAVRMHVCTRMHVHACVSAPGRTCASACVCACVRAQMCGRASMCVPQICPHL